MAEARDQCGVQLQFLDTLASPPKANSFTGSLALHLLNEKVTRSSSSFTTSASSPLSEPRRYGLNSGQLDMRWQVPLPLWAANDFI